VGVDLHGAFSVAEPKRRAHANRKWTRAKSKAGKEERMLKGIDPRLNADVLYVLRAMGHGDTIVLTDTNFPADAVASDTVHGELLRMENIGLPDVIEAMLSVMPLDTFVEDFAVTMAVVDAPDEVPPVHGEMQAAINAAEGRERAMIKVDRFAFYDLARESYAVVQTGERRFYGNVILRKGVIGPEA